MRERRLGRDVLLTVLRTAFQSPSGVTLPAVREALVARGGDTIKALLDQQLDQVIDTDLMVGVPQQRQGDWVSALRNLGSIDVTVSVVGTTDTGQQVRAEAIVPGRGEAMKGAAAVNKALEYTKRWVETLYKCAKEAAAANMDLKAAMAHTRKSMDPVFGHVFIYEHCLPFDVSRAFDEAKGIKNPRILTAERDKEMWASLQS